MRRSRNPTLRCLAGIRLGRTSWSIPCRNGGLHRTRWWHVRRWYARRWPWRVSVGRSGTRSDSLSAAGSCEAYLAARKGRATCSAARCRRGPFRHCSPGWRPAPEPCAGRSSAHPRRCKRRPEPTVTRSWWRRWHRAPPTTQEHARSLTEALVHFDGSRGMVGCPSISLAQALPMPHKHNAARRHHIPKMSFKVQSWPAYEAGLRQRGSLPL